AAGKFKINGVDLTPVEKTVALGKKIIDYRAEISVKEIRKAIGHAK
ncbi:MAG: creatininase family protein, partial [Planctomycetaceae bacterium]|nr:creatininase family protein [Planctomycetaceae bacterium]